MFDAMIFHGYGWDKSNNREMCLQEISEGLGQGLGPSPRVLWAETESLASESESDRVL